LKLSKDAKYEELTITVKILDEEFSSSGKNTISLGWTELMPWKQIDTKEMPSLREGDILQIGSVNYHYLTRFISKTTVKYTSNIQSLKSKKNRPVHLIT